MSNYFAAGDASRIEEIRFSNGTVWNSTQILANLINLAGTAGALTGTTGNDTFTVDNPSDTITHNGGTDTVNSYSVARKESAGR